jgi:hypothetical protein
MLISLKLWLRLTHGNGHTPYQCVGQGAQPVRFSLGGGHPRLRRRQCYRSTYPLLLRSRPFAKFSGSRGSCSGTQPFLVDSNGCSLSSLLFASDLDVLILALHLLLRPSHHYYSVSHALNILTPRLRPGTIRSWHCAELFDFLRSNT